MESRVKKVAKNGVYATCASMLTYLLSFVCRKVFIVTLGTDYLGYEGLFSNIFGLLSITESGFVSIMYFSLYKEVAEENYEEIANLMQLHKLFYSFVGGAILLAGTILTIFLPSLIDEPNVEWEFIYKIYFIQLIGTGINYFFSYRRTLFTVYQEAWKCVKVDGICNLFHSITRIVILYLTHNYYLYLLSTILYNLLANGIIYIKYKKRFPNIKNVKLKKNYMKERGLTSELKRGFLQNVAGRVFFGTDNIVITKIFGIAITGLYSNYWLIYNSVNMIFNKLTSGLNAAVGNYVHTENYENILRLYKGMNFAFYIIGMFMMDSYIVCFQSTIVWWLGKQYMLQDSLPFAIAMLAYLSYDAGFQSITRNTVGHYETDTHVFVIGTVLNIIISIVLSYSYGITGVVVGTIVAQLLIWIGRARTVYKYIIHESIIKYFGIELIKFVLAVTQAILMYAFINHFISGSVFFTLILRECVVILGIGGLSILLCLLTKDGRYCYGLIYNTIFQKRERRVCK